MEKKIMQDIVPNKRSIRQVSIDRAKRTSSRKRELPPQQQERPLEAEVFPGAPEDNVSIPPPPPRFRSEQRAKKFWLFAVPIAVVVLLAAAALSFGFSGATIQITPRREAVAISGTFTAYRNPEPGAIGFTTFTIKKTVSKEVTATGEAEVDKKASGRIVVFNDFNSDDQRLIANTRFETPEGLIFRVPESVVVPGRHTDANGDMIPGSVETEVIADTSGEEYNIGLTDFTIPGFEGDPRFFKFFARSKTPMTGGFSGVQKTVSDSEELKVRVELESRLEEELLKEAETQTTDEFIFYSDAAYVVFSPRPNADGDSNGTVLLSEEGTLYGLLVNRNDLAEMIAENSIASYDGAPVRFDDLQTLSFVMGEKDALSRADTAEVSFELAGQGSVVWTFDEKRLKEDFAGKRKDAVDMVLSAYPSVERAEINLKPFWKRTFPADVEDIAVEESLEK